MGINTVASGQRSSNNHLAATTQHRKDSVFSTRTFGRFSTVPLHERSVYEAERPASLSGSTRASARCPRLRGHNHPAERLVWRLAMATPPCPVRVVGIASHLREGRAGGTMLRVTTVLLVEDDPTVRELVSLSLESHDYAVVAATTGREAVDRWRENRPDLIVLDLMLPEADGFEVCRSIRQHDQVPIIMLTARSDPTDVVVGLESGADDYVTKPFETRVLLARIKAVLRRQTRDLSDPVWRFGDLEIDTTAAEVRKSREEVPLTPTEYRLLIELARNRRQVLSRETLLQRVWDYEYLGDSRLVDVCVGRLRAKIEDDPSNPTLIETRRGFGYRLVPPS